MPLIFSLNVLSPWLPAFAARLRRVPIRAPRAGDAQAIENFYRALGNDTLRQRFHCAFNGLSRARINQLCELGDRDPGRVQTRVAVLRQGADDTVVGHAGLHLDAPGRAEFALVVADRHQGRGIGPRLMAALVQSARAAGLTELHASVLPDNGPMVRLMLRLGTVIDEDPDEPGVLRVRLALRPLPRWARGSRLPAFRSPERTGFNAPLFAGLEVQERSCRAAGVAR